MLECLGIELPGNREGLHAAPARRGQLREVVRGRRRARRARRRSSTRCSARGRSGTGAGRPARSRPRRRTRGRDFNQQRWELFDTENDPSECHDLADEHPDKLQDLIALWWAEAGAHQALPLESRGRDRHPAHRRARSSRKDRNRYVYYPGCAEVPESVAPNIRNRSYTIAVELEVDRARRERRALRPGRALRRSRAVPQGRHAQVRLQLGRRARDRSSTRPSRYRPVTSSCRRPSKRRATRCRRRAR